VIPRIDALAIDGRNLPHADWMDIPAGAGQLAIDFGAVSLGDAASIELRHRLLPIAQGWTDGGARSFRAFGLPAGDYRFEVEASIDRQRWQRATIDFRIAPHWHERWPVRIALALAALALVVSVPMLRIASMRARARELGALVDERTAALTAANRQLDHIARTDALTGVANRRSFDDALTARAGGAGTPLALLLIDVDHFKAYNDRHGHLAGDACLVDVAACLRASVGASDALIARYGGEEFAILLPGASREDAARIADAIHTNVTARTQTADAIAAVSVSIGVAIGADGDGARSLMARADAALYRAKAAGRRRTEFD
jgi:diguanylate cyclase (GGDEF)-like protein